MKCSRCGKEIPDGKNKLCEDCQKSLLNEISSNENDFKVIQDEKEAKKHGIISIKKRCFKET